MPGKQILRKQIKPIFWAGQVYFIKSCQQIWWREPAFYTFKHHIWGETVYYETLFYHTGLGQNALFHSFVRQIAFIQYSGRSTHAWAFSRKIPKSRIRPADSHFWQAPNLRCELSSVCTLIELSFNIIKNLLCLFFYYYLTVL